MRIILLVLALFTLFIGVRSVFASSVVLNELMPHPSPVGDWVEIYNPTNSDIDLSNWTLVDSTSTMKTLSGSISVNGFLTFDVTNRLNNGGDDIYLKDSSGNIIDNYSYDSDPGINKSIGRSPDGGSWTLLVSSSKGSSNGEALPTPTPTLNPTPTPQPTSVPTPTPTPSSSPSPVKLKTTTPSKTPAPSLNPTSPQPSAQSIQATSFPKASSAKVERQIASIAGITSSTSPSPTVSVKSQKQTNYFLWAGAILIFAGSCSIGYIYFKKNADTHLKLRKRY